MKENLINRRTVEVPRGIPYLSYWKEFNLPNHPHILNKQITGCGFTQWCLTNSDNVILCSPRRILLENKEDQYLEEVKDRFQNGESELPYKLLYARNEYESSINIDANLNKDDRKALKKEVKTQNDTVEYAREYKQSIIDFYRSCIMTSKNCKILVTYDSFRKVREALEEINALKNFYVIVDEMQSIFVDSRFKADTEMEFVNNLQGIDKLCYASATPYMDKYLVKIEEFKDLPYYELDWGALDPSRLIRPKISSTPCSKINQKAVEIIEKYRTGNWRDIDGAIASWIDSEGRIQEVQSKEAVFYINSVKNICDIIRLADLKQEECNILVANTEDNKEAIRKAFGVTKKKFQGLGKVNKKSEMDKNKMFTFCTRTVYLGADFYSTNARSFIFSDANIECLAVDITLDLPQILGRQRNEDNPWKNELNIFFKPSAGVNVNSEQEFKELVDRKKLKTNTVIEMFNEAVQGSQFNRVQELLETYETLIKIEKYKNHYVSIDEHSGSNKVLKFNNLVLIAEERAFEIQKIEYADRCKVRSNIDSQFNLDNDLVKEILKEFDKRVQFTDRMKYLCISLSSPMVDNNARAEILRQVDSVFSNYYTVLGPDRIYSLGYRRDRLEKDYKKLVNNQDIDIASEIYSRFNEGDKISNEDLKSMIGSLYESLSFQKAPKASDIDEWFEIKKIKLKDSTGKWVNGIELVKKKEK